MFIAKKLFIFKILATLVCISTQINTYAYKTQSLDSCIEFTQQFRNTCNQTVPVDDFVNNPQNMVGKNFTCYDNPLGGCMEGATENSDGSCTWERKLCVTCDEDTTRSKIKIRVQTNNLPDHCIATKLSKPNYYDWDVDWNLPRSDDETVQTFDSQYDLNEAICPIQKTYERKTTLKSKIGLSEYGGEDWEESRRAMAVAINGVIFQFANNINEDPIFPIEHDNEQPLDICMGHVQTNKDDGMYHYHNVPPCLIPGFLDDKVMSECVASCECKENLDTWPLDAYSKSSDWNKKRVIGMSKFGHPMYSMHDENGHLWQPSDVDACNGVKEDGKYFNVATMWHPYLVGCWGPTNAPHNDTDEFYPQCSTNGIENYLPTDQPTPSPVVRLSIPTNEPKPDDRSDTSIHVSTCQPSIRPSLARSTRPSSLRSTQPSNHPSITTTVLPSYHPSVTPSLKPTNHPSVTPTLRPSNQPSPSPSIRPSHLRSLMPTMQPTDNPSITPTMHPTDYSSDTPTIMPSNHPSITPIMRTSYYPSHTPSMHLSLIPSVAPSMESTNKKGATTHRPSANRRSETTRPTANRRSENSNRIRRR